MLLRSCGWVFVIACWSTNAVAADLKDETKFLSRHCFDCHADGAAEGGLDLSLLDRDLSDEATFAKWERIYDRVRTGEMPPAEVDSPPTVQRESWLVPIATQLRAVHASQKQTVLRRLNRQEYENTLNDLFGTNLKLVERLPEDGRSHEFDNVGSSLRISSVQMWQYLDCAEAVLDDAIAATLGPPEAKVVRASYADTRGAEQWLGKIWLQRDDGAIVFFKQFGYPTGMLREATVSDDGWYKVRVMGYAFQSEKPITFSIGATTFARGAEQPTFGYFSLPPGPPTTVELKVWIPSRYMIDITPYGIADTENLIKKEGVATYQGPGLAIQHVEIEGPLVDEFPSRGHRLMFDGLNREEVPPRNPRDRERSTYLPKFEIISSDPASDSLTVLQRIATHAFRRPVAASQLLPYSELFESELNQGASFEEALRTAVTAILCSPNFLYLNELPLQDGVNDSANSYLLDDYSLASRLSYFLTRTSPDEELLAAAAAGQLSGDPGILMAQTERLLQDPRSERFITDFTDAWLNLREIDFTNPDDALFPEFDPFLKWSMVEETRGYFRNLLVNDLGVQYLVSSDFAILNNRLAEHYGISNISGSELRPVSLSPDSIRGGFLSQGAVLKVSANGTNTSPVVRGVYVLERFLGQSPPPPPPGIPGVEPDIRGATTLRELLDKHRSIDTCRSCHQKIDPPGFALESFDPVGGWRDHFRSLGEGERVDRDVNGRRVRYKQGPAVDASGQLPDGREFANYRRFRDLLVEDEETLARSLVTKLLIFATGREMGFSDRVEIEEIVSESAAMNHGVTSLVKLVIASDTFKRK